jgi:hypothetical protein
MVPVLNPGQFVDAYRRQSPPRGTGMPRSRRPKRTSHRHARNDSDDVIPVEAADSKGAHNAGPTAKS